MRISQLHFGSNSATIRKINCDIYYACGSNPNKYNSAIAEL
jgi:hypothetical protein